MSNQSPLRIFLDGQGCETTEEVMKTLRPFFRMEEKPELCLASHPNEKNIIEAVAEATDVTTTKIVFISNSIATFNPNLRSEHNGLGDRIATKFGSSIDLSRDDCLLLDNILVNSLGRDFQNIINDALKQRFGVDMEVTIVTNIFTFVGLSLINNQEQVAKIKPLLELMTWCIPIGFQEYKEREGELLVLVK